MIIVDVNLLIYATSPSAPEFPAAAEWLSSLLSGNESVRLPWSTVHAFLRLSTNPRVAKSPLSPTRALEIIDSLLRQPNVGVIEPGPAYWQILYRLIADMAARGNLIMDIHLVALALEHDATIHSADSDFRRFSGVRVVNPLQ